MTVSRLIQGDLYRLRHRRLHRLLVILLLIGLTILAWQIFDATKPLPSSATTTAQARCLDAQAKVRLSDPSSNFNCEALALPVSTFPQSIASEIVSFAFLSLGFGLMVGASLTGHEATVGYIANWLTYDPKRFRFMATKGLAGALWSAIWTALGLLLFVGLSWSIHRAHDLLGTTDASVWSAVASMAVRSVALVAVVSALGAALGATLKYTGAVIAPFAAWVVIELLFPQLTVTRWLLIPNIRSWIEGGLPYQVVTCPANEHICSSQLMTLSLSHSAGYLGALIAIATILAVVIFVRRDVT